MSQQLTLKQNCILNRLKGLTQQMQKCIIVKKL